MPAASSTTSTGNHIVGSSVGRSSRDASRCSTAPLPARPVMAWVVVFMEPPDVMS
jgi:hypothetical protein